MDIRVGVLWGDRPLNSRCYRVAISLAIKEDIHDADQRPGGSLVHHGPLLFIESYTTSNDGEHTMLDGEATHR